MNSEPYNSQAPVKNGKRMWSIHYIWGTLLQLQRFLVIQRS